MQIKYAPAAVMLRSSEAFELLSQSECPKWQVNNNIWLQPKRASRRWVPSRLPFWRMRTSAATISRWAIRAFRNSTRPAIRASIRPNPTAFWHWKVVTHSASF